jgi:hypothetical protein
MWAALVAVMGCTTAHHILVITYAESADLKKMKKDRGNLI